MTIQSNVLNRCSFLAKRPARRIFPRRLSVALTIATLGLQGCQAQQPEKWPLWSAYTQRFLDGQGRVIDRSAGDRTTSEGEAYAMFFALADNDRARFDRLLTWTETNLASGDLTLHLPAWKWGRADSGEWKTLDDNSASDADLWMAYSLIEAGRLWQSPRYTDLGRLLAARVAKEEVVLAPGVGTTLAPGSHGFKLADDTYIVNPSYLPLPLLARMAKLFPREPWVGVLASLPVLLSQQVAQGYAADWVSAGANGVHAVPPPAEATAGKRETQAGGSYDAIRVYLWIGMADTLTPDRKELLSALPAMANYLKTGLTPPLEVDATGKVVHADGPPGFSAAVIPYLQGLGLRQEAKMQSDRLGGTLDPSSSLYGHGAEYYDQNLALFSTGWSEHRFGFDRDGRLRTRWNTGTK